MNKIETDLHQLGDKVAALSERITRLEGANENDRMRVALELDRYKLAVERFLLRQQNPSSLPPIEAEP